MRSRFSKQKSQSALLGTPLAASCAYGESFWSGGQTRRPPVCSSIQENVCNGADRRSRGRILRRRSGDNILHYAYQNRLDRVAHCYWDFAVVAFELCESACRST